MGFFTYVDIPRSALDSCITRIQKSTNKRKHNENITACSFRRAIYIYGTYIFIDKRFWEKLFHIIDFQKRYDYDKTFAVFFTETVIMSRLFIAIGYYVKKILFYIGQKIKSKALINK